jgi:hypothetical protein
VKLTDKQWSFLAIAWNGSDDADLGAHVALPDEKRIVRQLEKRGLVRVVRAKTKTAGYPDWWIRVTEEGHRVYCARNTLAKATRWSVLERRNLVRIRWEPDPEAHDDSYIDTWTDRTPDERAEIKTETRAIVERNGCWGIIGEFRLTQGAEWEQADSVWQYVPADGDSESDCCYLADIKDATLKAFEDAASDAAQVLASRATLAGVA